MSSSQQSSSGYGREESAAIHGSLYWGGAVEVAGVGLGTGGSKQQIGAPRMAEFIGSLERKGIETKELTARLSSPIEFQPPGGGRTAYGYPAEVINDVCDVVLAARDADALQKQQMSVAKRCEILVRGLARVGIVALVDEVTGYQDIRARNALANILERFLADLSLR